MAPTEHKRNGANLLDLICDLIEQPRARIGASFLEVPGEIARLVAIGLLRPGTAPRTIACRACDEDHAATPEFDSIARRYFHFCPIAGRIEIEPRDLETLEVCARSMVDLLIAALPVLPAIGRELVAAKAWHLGEAVVGGTSLTVVFSRRIGSQKTINELAAAVAAVPVTEIGLILTSSPPPYPKMALPNHYTIIGLRDIATVRGHRLTISKDRLAAHIRMMRAERGRFRAAGGRPSAQDLIIEAYHRRRQRGQRCPSTAAEARAIISELAKANPDQAPPGLSTVRRHLAPICRDQS